MAATALTSSTRYFDPETTVCYWVADIADKADPTRIELDAGTDLSGEIAEISGWTVSGESIDTPDLGSRFTSSIPGRTNAADSSITFYADETGDDARTLMPRDTNGFIVWLDGGDVPANLMQVFPVRVLSVGDMRSVGNEAHRLQIQYSVTSEPAENVAVPAAV